MIEITKKVTFNLDNGSDKIDLPDLLSKQYVRNHIIALFEELQSLGYGEFKQGTRGRGQCHKFIKNDKCPNSYSIFIEEKPRGRPRKNANIKSETISYNPMRPESDEISSGIYNSNDTIDIYSGDNVINVGNLKKDIKMIAEDVDLTGTVSDVAISNNNESKISTVQISDDEEQNLIDGNLENIPF